MSYLCQLEDKGVNMLKFTACIFVKSVVICSFLLYIQYFRSPSVTSSPSHSPRQPRKAIPSSSVGPPPAPGPIDNTVLVATPACKVVTLTGEGGKLKRNLVLVRWRDFELVPDSLWKAIFQWYGGAPALPRQVCESCQLSLI